MPAAPRASAAWAYWMRLSLTARERAGQADGVLAHELVDGAFDHVAPQRVPRVEEGIHHEGPAGERARHLLDHAELGGERRLLELERAEPVEVARVVERLHPLGHGVGVVVHQLEPVEIVGLEEVEVGLGHALGGRVLQAEVVPHRERRVVHRPPGQRGPDSLDLVQRPLTPTLSPSPPEGERENGSST